MSVKEEVLKLVPDAFVRHDGTRKYICRWRGAEDLSAVVPWVALSNEWYTEDEAWCDALRRLQGGIVEMGSKR